MRRLGHGVRTGRASATSVSRGRISTSRTIRISRGGRVRPVSRGTRRGGRRPIRPARRPAAVKSSATAAMEPAASAMASAVLCQRGARRTRQRGCTYQAEVEFRDGGSCHGCHLHLTTARGASDWLDCTPTAQGCTCFEFRSAIRWWECRKFSNPAATNKLRQRAAEESLAGEPRKLAADSRAYSRGPGAYRRDSAYRRTL